MEPKNESWSGLETDRFMDMVLSQASAEHIAAALKKSVREVKAHFSAAFYNKKYAPSMPRTWRGGSRIASLEKRLISRYLERDYPMEIICKILQRKPNEIHRDEEGRTRIARMQEIAPRSDILMAHHYLYYCAKHPVISDQAYDTAKQEELEFGNAVEFLHWLDKSPKNVTDYPAHIRSLAVYIQFKNMALRNATNVDFTKLPAYYAPEGYWRKEGR